MRQHLFVTLVLLGSVSAWAGPYKVGQKDFIFRDESRDRKLTTHIWYPASPNTKLSPIGQSGPFTPVLAAENIALAKSPKPFPIVLVSHGSMGLGKRLFWLAEYLVQHGVVVLAVDHPGNMMGDTSADGAVRIWDRAKDLSFALDSLMEASDFKNYLDRTKVAAAGHSAGGATVLMLVGARFSSERFSNPVPNCSGSTDPFYSKQCDQFTALKFKSFPKPLVEGNYTDSRIKIAVALDPGFVRSFDPDTLRKLNDKAFIFVADKLAEPQDEIFSKEFSRFLPSSSFEVVQKAIHMTFLQACRPDVPLDDSETKELCSDTDQKLRIQTQVAEKILRLFQTRWTR